MKDYLDWSKFWNRPILNPTQNRYARFIKMPGSPLTGLFDDSLTKFKDTLSKKMKTHYSDVWDG